MIRRGLVFIRPFTESHGRLVGKFLFGDDVTYVSDFRGSGNPDLMAWFYAIHDSAKPTELSDLERRVPVREVILRDRWLRTLEYSRAERIVWAMASVLNRVLDEAKPDFVLGLAMDNYILDLLERFHRERGILGTYPNESSLPGLTRITTRGEHSFVREPSDDEVTRCLTLLQRDDFKPSWLDQNKMLYRLVRTRVREEVKRAVFPLIRLARRDPLSFHWRTVDGHLTSAYRANPLAHVKHFTKDWERRLTGKRPVAFLPLQFTPEASLEYYVRDVELSQYFRSIDRLVSVLYGHYDLLLKEHPAMYGYRDESFYKMLRQHPHVTLVPAELSVQALIKRADVVITYTGGTTGLETRVRQRKLVGIAESYYARPGETEIVGSYGNIPALPDMMKRAHGECDAHGLVKHVLRNTLPTTWRNWGVLDMKDRGQLDQVEKSADAVRTFLFKPSTVKRPMTQPEAK